MRKILAKDAGPRKTFIGTFARTGKKINYNGYSEDTILLTNIVDAETKEQVCDHIWFSYTKAFEKITLKEGCLISFDARVKEYSKGYVNRKMQINQKRTDFKLSHPTKVTLIE